MSQPNLSTLLQQAQALQEKLKQLQEDAANKTVEAQSGGGMVRVTVDGSMQVRRIQIDPSLLASNDKAMLEDLITVAVNEGSAPGAEPGRHGDGQAGADGCVQVSRAGVKRRTRPMADSSKQNQGLPPAMTRLVRELSRLPGIGEKTASRLAFNLLGRPREDVIALAEALLEMKERIVLCASCLGLSDRERCHICSDPARDPCRDLRGRGTGRPDGDGALAQLSRLVSCLARRLGAAGRNRSGRHPNQGSDRALKRRATGRRSGDRNQCDRRRRSHRAIPGASDQATCESRSPAWRAACRWAATSSTATPPP